MGAGSSKYRDIIEKRTSEYVTFDMVEKKGIDVVGDILDLSFKDKSFDTVISTQVLEHVEKPWIMIKEIQRILRKNGICILTAPFLVPYHADPCDYFRYIKKGIESLFKNENFEIIECDSYGRVFSVLSEFFHFSFFNPYKNPKIGNYRIINFTEKIAKFLDKFSRSRIIYSNVYIKRLISIN